jgi:hypothetical protein
LKPEGKTLTVDKDLDRRLNQLLDACSRNGISLDYSKGMNLLVELGERWLEKNTLLQRESQRDVWAKYIDYDKFERSVVDDWIKLEEFRKWKLKAKEGKPD